VPYDDASESTKEGRHYAAGVSQCGGCVMNGSVLLDTERLIVRSVTADDVDAVFEYNMRTDVYRRPTEPIHGPAYYSRALCRSAQERWVKHFADGTGARFLAFRRGFSDHVIGIVNLHDIRPWPTLSTMLGYPLHPEFEGHGYMHEALTAIIRWAFEERGLHRIEAGHLPENRRSSNVLRRLGFVEEGRLRQNVAINGEWRDHILTSLLNSAIAPD